MTLKSGSDATRQVNAFLRARINEWRASGKTLDELAAKSQMTNHSHLSQFLGGTKGFGMVTMERLSGALGIGDLPTLFNEAKKWADEHLSEVRHEPVGVDRYPTRAATIRWARECGYSEAAIERLRSVVLESLQDPGGIYWAQLIDMISRYPDTPLGAPLIPPAGNITPLRRRKR